MIAFLLGSLFGVGLILGGMTDPDNVIEFLTLNKSWNPKLAFVMGGALMVSAPWYRRAWAKHCVVPKPFSFQDVNPRLIFGSALFGLGWALAGICPGPALVSLANFQSASWLFVASMIAGMRLLPWIESRKLLNRERKNQNETYLNGTTVRAD